MSGAVIEGRARVLNYVAMRKAKPMPQLGDTIHGVNVGTEWEGELRLSDLTLLLQHVEKLETALKPFAFAADLEATAPEGQSVLINVTRCREAKAALLGESS